MRSRLRAACAALALTACTDAPLEAPFDGGAADAWIDPTTIGVRFDPEGTSFYRMPWPSDARTTADGAPELSDFSTSPALDAPIAEIEAAVRGFATMPVIYVGLTSPVSDASLPQGLDAMSATSPIQLVDLSESGCGRRYPLEIAFAHEGDSLRDDDVLSIANAIGTVLPPRTPHGLVITRSFGAPEGRTTPRPAAFDAALADTSGSTALARSLEPLRRCLPGAGVALDDVAVATVFTTQDPLREMQALRDYVMDASRLETHEVRDWRASESWSRRRLALQTFTGRVDMPMFMDGMQPYDEGGRLVFDASGEPVFQRWESVDIAVAVGVLESPPPGPRPVLVFIDGTGWEPWRHLAGAWVRDALAAGYVVMSFMPQYHGGRAGFTGNTEVATFDVTNPAVVRANFRQQAAETSYFLRLVRERIAGLAGLPALDTTHVVYGGHSQGAVCGAITAAVEDQYSAYAFNGLSSFLTLTIIHREDIIDFAALIALVYRYRGELDRWSPLLQLLQLGAEAVDPHNYAPYWHGTEASPTGDHVFVSNGLMDVTTTPRGMEHLTMCADMPPIAPPGWEVDPVGVWDAEPVSLPITGNETARSGAPLTIATYLDADQGHGTIYRRPFVRELAIRFWSTVGSGPPTLSSLAEYQCGDGADEDLDGLTDCADPDCASTPPCIEGPCDNRVDEDGNGLVDCADPACVTAAACRERDCGDGADDDGDSLVDCADPDCARRAPCAEERCTDGADDDGDALADCADPDCAAAMACHETACGNGADDDRDGAIDCADDECRMSVLCPELACADGLDEDRDRLVDCADPDCARAPGCARSVETACADRSDDDGDGAIDCADADCALVAACAAATCADGDLGAQLGVGLFSGTLAGRANRFPPGDCVALGEGGDRPDIALRWRAPAAGTYVFSTLGSAVDTVLSVIAPDCDATLELACDDDDGASPTSRLSLALEAGREIVVVIGAYGPDDAGAVTLHIYAAP